MDLSGGSSQSLALEVDHGRYRQPTEVHYYVAGGGPPVVLLHGIGLDSAKISWRHTLPYLAENHRVYALDFPGHGDSDRPPIRYTNTYFQEVLQGFLAELSLEKAPLVGVSMGGSVALGYALDNEIDSLILVDSYGLGHDAPWRPAASTLLHMPGMYRSWWHTIGASKQSVRSHLQHLTAGTPTESLVTDVYDVVQDPAVGRTISSWQRSEFRFDGLKTCYLNQLDGLTVPTLFIHGQADPLLPIRWSQRAAAKVDGSLTVFDNCGHWPSREAPEQFNQAVGGFL